MSRADRERVYRTEAIVLRRRNWGEADRILTLFSPLRGKFRAKAVGVRKPRSRKAGHLEPFTRTMILLARGRELDIITQAETVESFRAVQEDLIRLAAATYAADLLDRFSPEEVENRGAYDLLGSTLEALCRAPAVDPVLRYYDLHLLDVLGYRPQLNSCTVGQERILPQDQFFSPFRGGIVCPACAASVPDAQPLSLGALRVLRHLQRENLGAVENLRLSPKVAAEVEGTLQGYILQLLERPLKSPPFLHEVSGTAHLP
ncbi:MAG: DNA repair protein RecO [Anaerolineales bacterium]|jgi:DNA repair protein RecO (recombination protein O)